MANPNGKNSATIPSHDEPTIGWPSSSSGSQKSARVVAPLATAPKAAQRIRFFAASSVVRR